MKVKKRDEVRQKTGQAKTDSAQAKGGEGTRAALSSFIPAPLRRARSHLPALQLHSLEHPMGVLRTHKRCVNTHPCFAHLQALVCSDSTQEKNFQSAELRPAV